MIKSIIALQPRAKRAMHEMMYAERRLDCEAARNRFKAEYQDQVRRGGRVVGRPLNLPLIDKDEILERLFESKGVGDATWRRTLSRESDVIFQRQAASLDGAVLVSFWRLAGMPAGSGTPTAWLWDISNMVIVNVQCRCQPELPAARFIQRKRHRGHLDSGASYGDVLARLRELSHLGSLAIEPRIDVDTSQDASLDGIIREIRRVFAAA